MVQPTFFTTCGLVVLVLGHVSGEGSLFPKGKELVYRWHASVATGSISPSEVNSTWVINAKLTVQQSIDNTTVFKITNLNDTHSGNSLEKPFRATYNTGELASIQFDPADEAWSVNMKRALASQLQIKLDSLSAPLVSSSIIKEPGVFGTCNVEYVVSRGKKTWTVRKVVDHASCDTFPAKKYSTSPLSICPNQFQDILISDSERLFILNEYENGVLIQNVSSTGRILVQPYQATTEAHYNKIRQTIQFESITNIENQIEVAEDAEEKGLVFEHYKLDPTYGRAPTNQTEIINKIYGLLGELSDSLTYWEVGVKGLGNQTSFYLLDLMGWIDLSGWETLYNTVELGTSYKQETLQNLFWELVPKVGSHSAALFIRDLVVTKRIKGVLAGALLVNFPFYIRNPTEKLLAQCEDLLRLDKDVTADVTHSAVLGFSHLVRKTCEAHCETDTIDKFAKYFLDKFTESGNYDEQMLYLQGLTNLKLGQALDFLVGFINGQNTDNSHIRFLSAWSTFHTTVISPEKIYEVYWPIFTNRSESLELRVSALTLLVVSNPGAARFFSIYWYMNAEPSEQLYNFYYTTIQSISRTNYPCYSYLAPAAKRLFRFVQAKSRHWATGNYVLDFEDYERGYGGIMQALLIASEHSGLPRVFIFIAEQHSMGFMREYMLYLKLVGLDAAITRELHNISRIGDGHEKINRVLELLTNLKVPLKAPENLHLEIIFKVDGVAVISQYINKTSWMNWTNVFWQVSSAYSEFSVNHQSLNFPMLHSAWGPSDIGTPALLLVRSTSLTSARGSINQQDGGRRKFAELDLRHSWNSHTSLRVYNPFDNRWHGADRTRNLHIRLPFETHLVLHVEESFVKVNTVRHKGFVADSRLGLVWNAATKVTSTSSEEKYYPDISDEWSMDSEDLGGRLGASVFDCTHSDTLKETLLSLKGAFLANSKNYHMVPGGIVLLGLLSLRDQLQFLPTSGSSCGVMLYFSPLLTKVEPVLLVNGTTWNLSMKRPDGLLWEIKAGTKRMQDGNEEFTFKLYRIPSVSVTVAHIWRVKQLEGAFIVPLRMSGVFNLPAAVTGYAFVSWGDAGPSSADKAAMLDIKLIPGQNDSRALYCKSYTPRCLQSASDLATRQTVILQYANLPGWLKTAAHALFPEHIQTESSHTQITFAYPVALVPWNTKGLCALNQNSVLTLDNSTLTTTLSDCYSLAVADCSQRPEFSIMVKKHTNLMGAKLFCEGDSVELLPDNDGVVKVTVNDEKLDLLQEYWHKGNDTCNLNIRLKPQGVVEVELRSGVVLQHYNTTIVTLIPAKFRGFTCGMCGDFNGDTSNEPTLPPFTNCN